MKRARRELIKTIAKIGTTAKAKDETEHKDDAKTADAARMINKRQ